VHQKITNAFRNLIPPICILFVLFFLSACGPGKPSSTSSTPARSSQTPGVSPTVPQPTVIKTPTLEPAKPRLLTICLGEEPGSLFLYGDNSAATKSVLQAVYDGPFDIRGFGIQPVLFDTEPTLDNGGASLAAVQVKAGDLIVDDSGNLVKLTEGTLYRPSGCTATECAKTYSGSDPASLDQLVVTFKLKPGLKWSDGNTLTADDSVYSFQVARQLYPSFRPDLVRVTLSYLAVNPLTVEWKGIPGYESGQYSTYFFSPLPRHAWGAIQPADLASSEISAKRPIGWGPYVIDDWVSGDHISLSKNPNYFRAAEGLPHFDKLVFRFVADGSEALDALLAGECDLIDRTIPLDAQASRLNDLQKAGKVNLVIQKETAWEQITFGIASIDPKRVNLFASKEVRQATALCIDRSKIAAQLLGDKSRVLNSYVLPDHPLYNPDVASYNYDPQKASELLAAAGWPGSGTDPTAIRVSSGVTGIPDGTQFEFTYLASDDPQEQKTAQMVKESLATCGLQADIVSKSWNELLASGPDGPVFGRNFDIAQFGWTTSLEPACNLFLSTEISGPYPDFSKGWGGANASGYNNPEFDAACKTALTSLAGTQNYIKASQQAQAIFSADLPALPLFSNDQLIASRPDLCGLSVQDPVSNVFWNLESLDYGPTCPK
jgi:peptide/nickel transport system substrate-binding protein